MSVYEDPDELGYWVGGCGPPRRPSISEDEFIDLTMPRETWNQIAGAAHCAEIGRDNAAERFRRAAGYGGLGG